MCTPQTESLNNRLPLPLSRSESSSLLRRTLSRTSPGPARSRSSGTSGTIPSRKRTRRHVHHVSFALELGPYLPFAFSGACYVRHNPITQKNKGDVRKSLSFPSARLSFSVCIFCLSLICSHLFCLTTTHAPTWAIGWKARGPFVLFLCRAKCRSSARGITFPPHIVLGRTGGGHVHIVLHPAHSVDGQRHCRGWGLRRQAHMRQVRYPRGQLQLVR